MFLFSAGFKKLSQFWGMNAEFSDNKLMEWARLLYTRHGNSIRDIALTTGIEESAIRHWVVSGDWDGIKRTLPTSKEYQLEQLYILLEQVTDKLKGKEEVNSKDADLVVKYTAAIKNLDTETGIPQIVEVGKLFFTWLRRRDVELTKTVITQFDAFIKERLKPGSDC